MADRWFIHYNIQCCSFEQEIIRKQTNNGNVIIPAVTIKGTSDVHTFNNVPVTAHDLRNDMLQDSTITAMDVIMTMGELGMISYDLQYYEDIGLAEVKNYFVERINGDESQGRCGFVYEEGSNLYKGSKGNHIHIPSDIRVINSPEYIEYFWICL
jgi:hypothetical protein